MTKSNSFFDFLWVLKVFLRGNVLRQKAYRPQGNFFCNVPGTTLKRMEMFMQRWGFRPAKQKELVAFWGMAAEDDKRFTLISIDSFATALRIWHVRTKAFSPFDFDDLYFFCDILYYNGVSLEEQREGLEKGDPSFGTFSCEWSKRCRFLAVPL